ncbi:MAG: FMN-dependent NADPH-azoreductase [Verrucomicrobia subdivision 3 bacterium]|nr:FMN-dependent NADPH-azoreductase [Limisphaerales bacterium]MCS1412640.1 FMN-dependent NADPH-azoreductase [Limisphaerales bacterium]
MAFEREALRSWVKQVNKLQVLLVVGNCAEDSATRTVLYRAKELLEGEGCEVDVFDCASEDLPLFNVETAYFRPAFASIKARVKSADVFALGSPDYHGSVSSAMKNFLDHFWTEYAGKLIVSIVGSHEKGLTVHDQIRTVARQCYAWTLPYGISFHERSDFTESKAVGEALESRLKMMAGDVARYGGVLAAQRARDLSADYEGFMARYRA